MANKAVFGSKAVPEVKPVKASSAVKLTNTNITNEAGGRAYQFSDKHALAQLAVTGTFNGTFYTQAKQQLDRVVELLKKASPEYAAKVALYAREHGLMKDMPAFITAWLCINHSRTGRKIFPRVINDGRMLRNFVQFVRSPALGKKAFAGNGVLKSLVNIWLEAADDKKIVNAMIGNEPSLADIIRLTHPKPANDRREALYGCVLGKEVANSKLPDNLKALERFKKDSDSAVPDVPFLLLWSMDLSLAARKTVVKRMTWDQARRNLNAIKRHGLFDDEQIVDVVAGKLRDKESIVKAQAFPHDIMAALLHGDDLPAQITSALEYAMETAVENIPAVEGGVIVCPDVSGSMSSPATGYRQGATSKMTCHHVSALVAAAFLRRNKDCEVLPFQDHVVQNVSLSAGASIMDNARKLMSVGGGGTNCSAPMAWAVKKKLKAKLVVYVSDNQSWVDTRMGASATMRMWKEFREINPGAKLVCIDIVPQDNTQANDQASVLNIGGFSDAVFELTAMFASQEPEHWVKTIESMEI